MKAETIQEHVLLLEDDHFLLDMYAMKFMQAGFAVEPCASVAEALTALRGGLKPIAILFDIVMPGEDGYEFLRVVGKENLAKGATLIALTNQSSDADRDEATRLGADLFIVKATMIPSEVVAQMKAQIAKRNPV